ncbi:MAG: hypothetical protein MK080_00810 [Opitutales bacterium]|nr:hypothetical protein [Opitutales bacterium]NRA26230.1 hypothetical protein [Opitutales bacterium]
MIRSLFGHSKHEASLASATSRATAWREQCQRTEFEKRELEHTAIRNKAEIEELRKQNEYMRNALAKHHRLKEVFATTDKIRLEELRSAISNAESSDTILRTIFYLINKRQESCEIAENEVDVSNGFKMAYSNGGTAMLRRLKEDFLSLIAEAGSDRKELKDTRSPFSNRREKRKASSDVDQAI